MPTAKIPQKVTKTISNTPQSGSVWKRLSIGGKKLSSQQAILVAAVFVVVFATIIAFVRASGPNKSLTLLLNGATTGNVSQGSDGSIAFNGTTSTPPPAGKNFYVVGKQIIDPDGNVFVPMGGNVAFREAPNLEHGYVFNLFGTANGQSSNVQAWGWNTIRVNSICGLTSGPSLTEALAGFDELVKEYTAPTKKIVVLVDCHDATVKDYAFSNPTIQATLPFIDAVAARYKDNPYVWFNTLNEPFQSKDTTAWQTLQNALYARVRALAPNNIIVADLGDGGNQIDALVDGNLAGTFGSGKCNVVYGWHSYGFINGFADDAKHKDYINRLSAKNVAMVIGEFGDPLNENGQPLTALGYPGVAGNPTQNRIGANAVISYAPSAGYGMLWWHATGDSNSSITYSLTSTKVSPWTINTSNLNQLSATGRRFWDLSHAAKTTTKFTGKLSDSGCASAQ